MYLTLKQYLRTLFLRLLLKTGTPFYVVIRPREGPAVFKAKAVTSFLGDFSPAGDCCCCCCCCVDVLLFCFVFSFLVSITMILNFLPPGLHCTQRIIFWGLSTQKKLEGFVWGFLSITGLRSQRQFAPKCSFLASRPLGHCSFRISGQIS